MLTASLLLLLAPDPSAEAGPWLTTRWTSSPGCIDDASLDERSAALVGAQVEPAPTRVELSAAPGETWTIGVRLSDDEGIVVERQLRGEDCETLTDAVALIVAVHVDAVGVVRTRPTLAEPTAVAAAVVPAPAEPEPVQALTRVEPAPTRTVVATPVADARVTRPRVSMSASVAGEVGLLPRGAASFEIASGLWWPHVRIDFAGLASLGPDARATTSLPSASFGLFGGAARGCGVITKARLEVALCAAIEIADLRAKTDGRSTEHAAWVAATPSARPMWVIVPKLALYALVDLPIALRRHRYLVDGANLHTVAPVAARFGVGLQVRLP